LTVKVITSNVIRVIKGELPMMWRRWFLWDADGTRRRPQQAARGRDRDATRRHRRPGVEALEGRQLLAALAQFPLSSDRGARAALTAGPDGNLWFPETALNLGSSVVSDIGRITPAGGVTDFPLPAGYSSPSALTVGPDNNLWFTDLFNSGGTTVPAVAQITPDGVITEYQTKSNYSSASALTVGPDNNLWFTENTVGSTGVLAASVGRATTAGVITEFTVSSSYYLSPLTVGPDGNLWFTAGSEIDRITPAGAITEFPPPSIVSSVDIAPTVGPDGNLWFPAVSGIDRITPAGAITVFPAPSISFLSTLTVGPDGNLWFTGITSAGPEGTIAVGRTTLSGAVTVFPIVPVADGGPPHGEAAASAPVVGPDKNLYFTFLMTNPFIQVNDFAIVGITPSGDVFEAPAERSSTDPYAVTATVTTGSDGNLWFPVGTSIGRLDLGQVQFSTPMSPSITGVVSVTHSKKEITTIVLDFSEGLDPGSAGNGSFYSIASGVKKRHKLLFAKNVKIAGVSYDGNAHTVTLKLAKPFKGKVQVTVRSGIAATNGTSTQSNFTAVVR
jgi:virginiamycin B lyase